MAYERLIQSGRIQAYKATPEEVRQLLHVAERDLSTAEKNLPDAPDWAYSIAYNAVLQASRALMLSEGFRPRGAEQHATVVAFLTERLGKTHPQQTRMFDQMRRKRHRVIYEVAGLVSRSEAEQVLSFSRGLVEVIRSIILDER